MVFNPFVRVECCSHYKGRLSMNRIILNSKVSSDGTLRFSLPLGMAEADHEVRVTVEPVATHAATSQSEWEAWVDAMAGSWQGDFERPPQADYEQRETLS
jgi:hypothetical protein